VVAQIHVVDTLMLTRDLLATPRLLVKRDTPTPNYLFEILLLDVSPSGEHIRYKAVDTGNTVWSMAANLQLVEVLSQP